MADAASEEPALDPQMAKDPKSSACFLRAFLLEAFATSLLNKLSIATRLFSSDSAVPFLPPPKNDNPPCSPLGFSEGINTRSMRACCRAACRASWREPSKMMGPFVFPLFRRSSISYASERYDPKSFSTSSSSLATGTGAVSDSFIVSSSVISTVTSSSSSFSRSAISSSSLSSSLLSPSSSGTVMNALTMRCTVLSDFWVMFKMLSSAVVTSSSSLSSSSSLFSNSSPSNPA
mmetsp:Transcript_20823/g.45321  ORF Transcript_20823/g.45321 Transcript_20823/m.45321 type:complete len:233 (+) Transcript_20823:803-1501(+)